MLFHSSSKVLLYSFILSFVWFFSILTPIFADTEDNKMSDPEFKALLAKLEDTDEFVRMKAAKTLGEMGPEAQAAIAALTEISQNDPDEDVRRFALDALQKIKPTAVDAKPLPEMPKVTPNSITITRTITLFSEAYQDVSGLIKSPSSRMFFVKLKNNSVLPVNVPLLRVRWFDNDKEVDMAEVEGPEEVILPDCEISHYFSFPQSKSTIQWKIEVIAVKSVELTEEDRKLLEQNSRLLKNMKVLKPRVIEKFGVVVGDKFTIYNPSSKLAPGVRVMLLGYDKNDRLVSIQFYYCEDVPQGFTDVLNDATIDPEKKKKSIAKFENFADAGKDSQAAQLKGEVVAVGVRKMEE
jgi:HEAT repeats